ncbi:MAG: hypothetical protein GF344_18505, partial [Chitinivibrionales bacterium]|nr:hypothetical protein [Chitinivibrionales bacterium]MBD3358640.1 hypothetical protein [Chitinivibrionales bacterium]
IVLLTPGFITDVTGFLILIPPTRARLRIWLKNRISNWISRGGGNFRGPPSY